MDAQQYRRLLKEGDINILHKDYKGIEWAEKELKRIRAISDLEEQRKEAEQIWWICDRVYYLVYNPPQGVDVTEPRGLNHFKKIYEGLKYLKNKSVKVNKNNLTQDSENDEMTLETSKVEGNNQEEYINCQQCFKEIKAGKTYWYHKSKNDNHKFCSTNCYQEYYGECCSKCVNENKNFAKYLDIIHDGDDTCCSTCYEKVKQEKEEEREKSVRCCKYCSAKLIKEGNLKYSLRICDKEGCLLKLDKEVYPDKYGDNNSKRERERERDKSYSTIPITYSNHTIRTKSYS